MSLSRFNALSAIENRLEPLDLAIGEDHEVNIATYFDSNVFTEAAMKKHLPEDAYLSVKAATQSGAKISQEVADIIANGMKEWAMSKGCTHFAHWFQPLTGKTAEKHDSFFTMTHDGRVIEEFQGSALVQQEPDGSSFPNGGLRSTFEARGYTVWDPGSPAFIMEVGVGKTLCIPTIFVTYDGEATDYKLPLLRSQSFLNEAAVPVCQMFDKKVEKVIVTLGWEQEYFVIDEALFNARPDLQATGRTLLGQNSARNQQLDDHYFGSIPERVYAFMRDLEVECHKLGIPVRTRHNEVAPGQYEVAPIFEEINVAIDHNQLLMDLMDRVSRRHRLRVLLHEKPFAGVNGSGKHNNWSMAADTGVNLLSPGKTPSRNLRFLTFFVNTIMAVHKYGDLLRAAIASAGNDHRLGANEAPPAIISVFIGSAMTNLLNQIAKGRDLTEGELESALDLLSKLPDLTKDNTDRNRTSPFAFTGNKFEIRAVGSSANCAATITTMNSMMGIQLQAFKSAVDKKMEDGMAQDKAILSILKSYVQRMRPILFEGNNYSDEWKEEAAKRGLNNFLNTPAALEVLGSRMATNVYVKAGVMSKIELSAYQNVQIENYISRIRIEAVTLKEMVKTMVLPVAVRYQSELATNIGQLTALDLDDHIQYQTDTLERISENIHAAHAHLAMMDAAIERAHHEEDALSEAKVFAEEVRPHMDACREAVDTLETLVDDQLWPLVKYRELLLMGK